MRPHLVWSSHNSNIYQVAIGAIVELFFAQVKKQFIMKSELNRSHRRVSRWEMGDTSSALKNKSVFEQVTCPENDL